VTVANRKRRQPNMNEDVIATAITADMQAQIRSLLGDHWLRPGRKDAQLSIRELCAQLEQARKEIAELKSSVSS